MHLLQLAQLLPDLAHVRGKCADGLHNVLLIAVRVRVRVRVCDKVRVLGC